MKRFRTITLGCRVNQYETAYVREALLVSGWEETPPGGHAGADLVLINTCSVTAESDAKCRKAVSAAAEQSPNAEIVIMGCYASAAPDLLASYPRVSEVLTDKRQLADFIRRRGWEVPRGVRTFGERHRAYIKIQDGCRVGCSYCIIPKVRPYLSSRTEEDIIGEVAELARLG
ncbi:MAG: tRNA (N(6)-L-threonylcarbamoyladenosine(37)-C(2))-methylthiotransferase MtaB, partial [Thermoguttaceae bacterium]|nr:tRNA (N(6)-L-threonylcarbamoyladenosine(37)-C(2))-methylthiotransferase MtaB [Thermoguttaceae bacterium]